MKNELVKKAYIQEDFDLNQLIELKRCALNPIYFIKNYVKVRHPAKGPVLMKPYSYQIRALEAFHKFRRVILLQSRQTGKTAIVGAYLLWYATFHEEKEVMVASKDNAAAMDILARIKYAYEELPMWLKAGCKNFTQHKLNFDNGSSIESTATTEDTGRGRSLAILFIDELCFVDRKIQKKLWISLAPTLSTGGQFIISSTPNGEGDIFSETWHEAIAHQGEKPGSFFPIFAPWFLHPERGDGDPDHPEGVAFKQSMIGQIGELAFRQECDCEFLSSDPLLVNPLIMAAWKSSEPLYEDHGFKFWEHISGMKEYLVGSDVSEGIGNDFSTIQVFDINLNQIAEFRNNHTDEAQLYEKMKWIVNKITDTRDFNSGARTRCMYSYENNSCGRVITTLYYKDEFPPEHGELISVGDKLGMNTNGSTKKEACKDLKRLLDAGLMTLRSADLISEFKNYAEKKNSGIYEAKSGSTDDLVSATLIITRLFKFVTSYDDQAFTRLYKSRMLAEKIQTNEPLEEQLPMPFVF